MAEAIATLSHWWQIILAGVGIVASYIRLQAKVSAVHEHSAANREGLEKLEARLTKQRDEDVARTARSLESIDKKLDRLVDHILSK